MQAAWLQVPRFLLDIATSRLERTSPLGHCIGPIRVPPLYDCPLLSASSANTATMIYAT
jgi:hypothetical protein